MLGFWIRQSSKAKVDVERHPLPNGQDALWTQSEGAFPELNASGEPKGGVALEVTWESCDQVLV